jgi:hypothetical protein
LQVRSADDPDGLRGEGLNLVVMDECAFVAEAAWSEAIRPALSDRKGGALFISTPKGHNWFWRLWERGHEGHDWQSWRFPSVSNPFLDPAEIEAARLDLPERVYQQEYEATFLEDGGGVFRGVTAAVDRGRTRPEPPAAGRQYFLGVDLAKTEDFTVLAVVEVRGRDDFRQVYHERFNQISWTRQIDRIATVARQYKALAVIDSTGMGEPIFDQVKQAGVRAMGYNLTNASKESLIDALAIRLEKGHIRLMDLPAQTAELLAYQYELTPSRNVRMNAPEGMHDDCVIALALASWGAGAQRTLRVVNAR